VESWFDWYDYVWRITYWIKKYIEFIEKVEVPIKIVSVGQTENKLSSNKIKNALKFQGVFLISIKPFTTL
jgi:adenylosuccinate synthase